MPTFKKYDGIKACEHCVHCCTPTGNSSYPCVEVRPFKAVNGNTYNYLYYLTYGASYQYITKTTQYLSANIIKASADDYDANDYDGTSTGTCTFTSNKGTGGVSYQIQFTANENATIKCFKFYKTLNASTALNGNQDYSTLMFAVYFDEPISVTAGQILNMSLNFAFDDQQVTII